MTFEESGAEVGYKVPAEMRRVANTVKRSRFITTVARAAVAETARHFVAQIRAEFPDATHHCWAYVAGPPGDTRSIGMSDDGEPHGTAGKPMLNALLHSGVGEIVAVGTRYYGGVKLGTGGLSRAYAGGVTQALEELPVEIEQELSSLVLEVHYEHADAVQRLAAETDVVVEHVVYGAEVRLELLVPAVGLSNFVDGVKEITRGHFVPILRPSKE